MAANTRRLGVALVLDPPLADMVDGLRQAIGDPSLGRIPPHITLVPPVNIRADLMRAALARVRMAAARQPGPLRLTLGPPAAFLPDNPVLFLEVGGDLPALAALRDAVFAPPLERTLSWPWVPHVTVADGTDEARILAALVALDRFAVVAPFDRLVVLQETRGRIWLPIADAALGAPAVVGTGGLALEITTSRMLDPEVMRMIEQEGIPPGPSQEQALRREDWPSLPIILSARREGDVVGAAAAWRTDDGGHVAVIVASDVRRQGIGATLLAHLEAAVVAAGWECPVLEADGPPGFYQARSAWSVVGSSRTPLPRTRPAS
jgi:2'-5' RNA ligase/GNAT superfamily N-acetyltransferase